MIRIFLASAATLLLTAMALLAAERLEEIPRECAALAARAGFPPKLTAVQARAARARLALQDQQDPEVRRCNAAIRRADGDKK